MFGLLSPPGLTSLCNTSSVTCNATLHHPETLQEMHIQVLVPGSGTRASLRAWPRDRSQKLVSGCGSRTWSQDLASGVGREAYLQDLLWGLIPVSFGTSEFPNVF